MARKKSVTQCGTVCKRMTLANTKITPPLILKFIAADKATFGKLDPVDTLDALFKIPAFTAAAFPKLPKKHYTNYSQNITLAFRQQLIGMVTATRKGHWRRFERAYRSCLAFMSPPTGKMSSRLAKAVHRVIAKSRSTEEVTTGIMHVILKSPKWSTEVFNICLGPEYKIMKKIIGADPLLFMNRTFTIRKEIQDKIVEWVQTQHSHGCSKRTRKHAHGDKAVGTKIRKHRADKHKRVQKCSDEKHSPCDRDAAAKKTRKGCGDKHKRTYQCSDNKGAHSVTDTLVCRATDDHNSKLVPLSEKGADVVKKWKNEMQFPYIWLVSILNTYAFPDFLGLSTDFVQQCANDPHVVQKINRSVRLIYPNQLNVSDVVNHHILRHPVHIGGPQWRGASLAGITEGTLGYSESDARGVDSVTTANMRYAVLGWTPIEPGTNQLTEATILHVWGVNLESATTTDAKYVFADGTVDLKRYDELLRKLFDLLYAGACETARNHAPRPIVMRLPGLGLGEWLKAVHLPTEKDAIFDMYHKHVDQLQDRLHAAKYNVQVRELVYRKSNSVANIKDARGRWTVAEQDADPFGPPTPFVGTPKFVPYPEDCHVLMVNAWDDRSFIGNRGVTDKSLDGWMVAGGGQEWNGLTETFSGGPRFGGNFRNASYLHNAFFNTHLLTHTKQHVSF